MLLLHTLPPLPGTPGEIMLPQIHIRHKHFPKDYAPDKSLHFSTWFIAEYIVCLHMQEQITSDLYFHNDYCSDSFTPRYIDVRANHLYKKGRGTKEWMTIQSNKKDKRLKKKAWLDLNTSHDLRKVLAKDFCCSCCFLSPSPCFAFWICCSTQGCCSWPAEPNLLPSGGCFKCQHNM